MAILHITCTDLFLNHTAIVVIVVIVVVIVIVVVVVVVVAIVVIVVIVVVVVVVVVVVIQLLKIYRSIFCISIWRIPPFYFQIQVLIRIFLASNIIPIADVHQ